MPKFKMTTAAAMLPGRETFLNEQEDIAWLKSTHLHGMEDDIRPYGLPYLSFHSAVLIGNEDSPIAVYLFKQKEPHYRGRCLEIDLRGKEMEDG